jgi:hypothetical protein
MSKVLYIILISLFSLTIISCASSSDDGASTTSDDTTTSDDSTTDNTTTTTTDTTAPDIAEVTAVTTPSNDPTPNYTFSSSEAGTITYGGSCSSSTTSATSGNNTITLVSLSEGTYSNCTITVTDSAGNVSNPITITSFIVDLTAATLVEVTAVTTPTNVTTPNYTFSSSEAGTITYGGSCSSSTTSATTDNNTITLVSLSEGTYSNCTITVTDNSSNSVTLNISSFVIDTTAPTVSSISTTADNQSSVSITDNITVTFSEAMDTTYVTTNTDNTSCSGTLRVSSDNFSNCVQMASSPSSSNSDKTFTLDPSDNLTGGTTYLTRVTTGVKDAAGNAMSSQYDNSTGFTTLPATYKLPDTGQTVSYTNTVGEDHDYLINSPSFIINDSDTVTDNNTHLMWQRQDDGTRRTWADAEPYCSGLSLGGQSDWRIPEPHELQTIVDFGKSGALDATYFTGTDSTGYYWSTTYAASSSKAWYMRVGYGTVGDLGKTNTQFTRCVRGANRTSSFTDNGDNTTTDTKTRLVWQKSTSGSEMTWEEALSSCEALTLASQSDWRLPNIKELFSIVDTSEYNPAIDETYFPATQSADYWSSTTYLVNTTNAWRVDFNVGTQYSRHKTDEHASQTADKYVRCVRGGQ